jgi:hypothetical protein
MNPSQFLQSVATGNAAEAQEVLNDLLSARAFEALDAKKVEIAQSLFSDQDSEEVEVQNTADTENA